MSKYAEQILNLIQSSREHLTAEQIYFRLKQSCPKLVLATVYNNLNQLHRQNRIRKISVEGRPERYDRTDRHDHLVCVRCGRLSGLRLPDLTAQLQAQLSEEILSYDLKINCICPDCMTKETENQL